MEDNCLYNAGMEFTWNPEKRLVNLKKHGLDFADAWQVFDGLTLTIPDRRFAYGEARFSTMGILDNTVVVIIHVEIENEIRIISVVVIIHVEIENEIRIISMRKAERYERENYFASL